jgi:hypothetical protein
MKKLKSMSAWVMSVFCLTAVLSCSKDEDVAPDDETLPGNVEQLFLMLDYETGYGGYIYPVYNPYVFFNDGRYVKEPKIPVEELNLDALTSEEAYSWGTWKREEDQVFLTDRNGEEWDYEWPGEPAFAATKGESIAGAFSSISGGGNLAVGGDIGVISYSSMTFTADGWFTNEQLGGGSGSSHSAYAELTTAGRYELDGYTITLRFNNGDTKRFFFCYYGADKRVFRIAGRTYTE